MTAVRNLHCRSIGISVACHNFNAIALKLDCDLFTANTNPALIMGTKLSRYNASVEGLHPDNLNPQVDTLWTALWWACMSMTTAGSNITPVTTTGSLLEIFLSAEGMMLLCGYMKFN